MNLADLPDGAKGRVVAVRGEALLRERIVELGFTPGTLVSVRCRAVLGGPIEVRLRGGMLAVRRDEAACVSVEQEPER
jgi:Fe2+ transport system protein FeoA